MTKFMIVTLSDDGTAYEVGLADGINRWRHMASCRTRAMANHVCTLLAMHFKVASHELNQEVEQALRENKP